jgi:hypothetical protein
MLKVIYFKNGIVQYNDLGPKEKEEVRQAMREAKSNERKCQSDEGKPKGNDGRE